MLSVCLDSRGHRLLSLFQTPHWQRPSSPALTGSCTQPSQTHRLWEGKVRLLVLEPAHVSHQSTSPSRNGPGVEGRAGKVCSWCGAVDSHHLGAPGIKSPPPLGNGGLQILHVASQLLTGTLQSYLRAGTVSLMSLLVIFFLCGLTEGLHLETLIQRMQMGMREVYAWARESHRVGC